MKISIHHRVADLYKSQNLLKIHKYFDSTSQNSQIE